MGKNRNFKRSAATRNRKRTALLGVTAGLLSGLVGIGSLAVTATSPAAAATTSSSTLAQGVYVGGGDPSGVASFAASTKTSPTIASDYLPGGAGWAGMDGAGGSLSWLTGPWSGKGYTLSLGVPIIPTDSSGNPVGTLAAGATGAYNSYYVTLAQTLVAAGDSGAYLRIGWEFDGGWYTWSATTPAQEASFAAYFDQIVTAMRSVSGANFKFMWNPDAGAFTQSGYNVALAYPGNAYVDDIGLDSYDQTWVTPQTPTNAWNETALPSLVAAKTFAQAQDKPLGFAEWGVATRGDGHGLGDDPLYINNMAAWMQNPANNVAFESYFNYDISGQVDAINDGTFPNSLAAFKSDFASGAPISAPTPPVTTTTTPTTTPSAPVTPPTAPVVTPTAPVVKPPVSSAPGAVTGLTASVTGTTVGLKWSNPGATTGDRIYINGALKTTLNAAGTSFSMANAPTGWHSYNVSATNAMGTGAQSNSATVFVQAPTAAPAPTAPVVVAPTPPVVTPAAPATGAPGAVTNLTASVRRGDVTLTWTNPSGAASNNIYINGVLLTTLSAAVTTYVVTNAPRGWHSYNVTAFNAAGEGTQSNSVTNYVR